MSVGKQIKKIRTEKGLKLKEVADGAGLSVTYLSRLENDLANPTMETLDKLATFFEVPSDVITTVLEDGRPVAFAPDSLKDFIDTYGEKYPELKEYDWQRMLSSIRLRGQYPTDNDSWLAIFLNLRSSLRDLKPQ